MGRFILGLWVKSARMTVRGEESYLELRREKKPVVLLVWHGRIFPVPYLFRFRGSMPLISPSQDGEVLVQIISRWGFKVMRGSSSHPIKDAWNAMISELRQGGEVIIVPDGPKGPDRRLKLGGVKLAQETGAYLVPFSFSASRPKVFNTWDSFMVFKPFSKVLALYGRPFQVYPDLKGEELELERKRIETLMNELDAEADAHFNLPG